MKRLLACQMPLETLTHSLEQHRREVFRAEFIKLFWCPIHLHAAVTIEDELRVTGAAEGEGLEATDADQGGRSRRPGRDAGGDPGPGKKASALVHPEQCHPRRTVARVGAGSQRAATGSRRCWSRARGRWGWGSTRSRSWVGWHRHMTLALLALWFLTLERRRLGGKNPGLERGATAGGVQPAAPATAAAARADRGGGQSRTAA